jgi:hypothetical protein
MLVVELNVPHCTVIFLKKMWKMAGQSSILMWYAHYYYYDYNYYINNLQLFQTSLYPFVLTDEAFLYPNGHPEYITEKFPETDAELYQITGLVKAEVLPPRELYWPILWNRDETTGTLTFPLCRTCGERKF